MIIEQIWTGNNWRNFNYLIVCPESGQALAVDPLDHIKCLGLAKEKGWEITHVLNTHEHGSQKIEGHRGKRHRTPWNHRLTIKFKFLFVCNWSHRFQSQTFHRQYRCVIVTDNDDVMNSDSVIIRGSLYAP